VLVPNAARSEDGAVGQRTPSVRAPPHGALSGSVASVRTSFKELIDDPCNDLPVYCAQTGDFLWPDPVELSRPSPAKGSAKGTAAKAYPVRRPESSGTAIPLDLPFRLLVGSYVVSRVWAVPALKRPSTDLPTGLLPPSNRSP
jgi:hypothetical protein